MPRSKYLRLCAAALILGVIPACGEKAEPMAPPPTPPAGASAAPLPPGPAQPTSDAGSSASMPDPGAAK
jgi:hypothetical protein